MGLGTILEISLTLFVTTIAIEFDRLTSAFTRSATVFSARLRLARTRRIPTFLFVSHDFPLETDRITVEELTIIRSEFKRLELDLLVINNPSKKFQVNLRNRS